jgi:hypothetical protein
MLDVLGLGVSDGASIDDDELWDAMLSMGIRLLQPRIPVSRCMESRTTKIWGISYSIGYIGTTKAFSCEYNS